MDTMKNSTMKLHFGAAYYPEHWSPAFWQEDIYLMNKAGFTVVRMGEFAWSSIQPQAGQPDGVTFQLDWLSQAVELLAESGIATVLGTPTAAPPAWLVYQYPDLLAVDENGRRVQFGNRCHYCVNSPDFHQAVREVVAALGQRFGRNSNVIGWQIDNEYNRVCYCDRCQGLFQQFLQSKYGTLEALNECWTTAYWSQTYTRWEQIPLPVGAHNPSLMLDFKRFVTESYRKFQSLQLDALRPHLAQGVWVTHNFMGWYDGFDPFILSKDLDLASWDWYIGSGHHDYLQSGAAHDLTRGFKRKNFWVMETQPGNVNWSHLNNTLDRGEARAMAWHAVAHGADGILYWQWRSALGGQEQYHGTLVDQSGQPRPFYEDVQQIGAEFSRLSELVAGSQVKAKVAFLVDYDSRWALQWQRHHPDYDYLDHWMAYYRPLAQLNVPVDILPARHLESGDALHSYRIIFAPGLNLVNEHQVDIFREYLSKGGHLVLTARSGMKDDHNALLSIRQPGLLREMAGVEVEEYYALESPMPIKGNWFEGHSRIWAERLKTLSRNTQVIARYGKGNNWLEDQVAITVSGYRTGLVYYVGAYLDETAQQAMLARFLRTAKITMIGTSEGVEVYKRVSQDGKEINFVINHLPINQTIWLPWPAYDYIKEQEIESELNLSAYDLAILTMREPTDIESKTG